ncbi:MAG: low affinity iron permease family protein [Flavobacterium sp.]
MKQAYFKIERYFERLVSLITKILGNSFTFILALILVLFWWITSLFTSKDLHQNIGDIIFGATFLSLFIIQKSFNMYSALIHLKINELISSHEAANNSVMNTAHKTEHEIREMSEEYIENVEAVENEFNTAVAESKIENQM